MSEENVPFEVTEQIEVGDLSDVKEQRQLTPVASKVKVRIAKASVQETKDKDIKSLKLELRIVDGIEAPVRDELGNPTGETKMAYQNKPLFTGIMDLVVWADVSVKGRSEKNWWKTKQYLVGFKGFLIAVGSDLKSVKVNDEFLSALIGAEVLVDIQHEEETAKDEHGETVKLGTYRERLKNFRKVA